MPKLTKKQFEEHFRDEVLPHVIERYEQDGIPDKPARREAWNDTVDAYIKDRQLPEAAGNWSHPRWLETHRPQSSGRHYSTVKTRAKFSNKQIGGYLQAAREPFGISFNDNYNKPTYGITQAEYGEIDRAMHAKYGMSPERTLAGVRKALEGRQHSTIKSQRGMMDDQFRKIAETNETFLELLPTLRRKELESLIAKRPALWGRFAGYLTSGHVFADDAKSGPRQHSTVKSPSQLDREITQATGIGTWKKSDQPRMSEHLDIGHAGARVQPLHAGIGYYEWTIWIGQPGRRVLHQSGETRTKAGAKGAAERKLAALR